MAKTRTPLQVTLSVWKALFLREAVHRLLGGRAAWAWLLLEPLVHVGFMIIIFTVVSVHTIGGIETSVWLMAGMVAYFMFKRTATQGMNAISANQALFSYRQVKPVDTVIVRAALEAFLMLVVTVILFTGADLMGVDIEMADPLEVFLALFGLWLFGVGFGLITSVVTELVSELGKIIELMMTPLYFISGVMAPIIHAPLPYREWLMLNPISHGLEALRHGIAPYYQAAPETDLGYLYIIALVSVFFGLTLHVRYALRLTTQ